MPKTQKIQKTQKQPKKNVIIKKRTRKHLNKNKPRHITTRKNHQKKILPVIFGKIYMNECIHCMHLEPEWNIVIEKMKNHNDVVCYDIEREEESVKFSEFNNNYKPYEPLQIQGGYPTIYKLHKRGGMIIYYQGPRDNQSIMYWLQGK
jgi:hypothetical protein